MCDSSYLALIVPTRNYCWQELNPLLAGKLYVYAATNSIIVFDIERHCHFHIYLEMVSPLLC